MKLTKEDLLLKCDKCSGLGEYRKPDGLRAYCDKCSGKGQVLTETGEAIKALIQFLGLNTR